MKIIHWEAELTFEELLASEALQLEVLANTLYVHLRLLILQG